MVGTAPNPLTEAIEYCPTTSWEKIQNEDVLLLDVREKNEVEQLRFDVPNYLTIPFSELEKRFNEIPRDKTVILACLSGERSLKATYFLIYHGYKNVANMRLGLKRWIEKGFPFVGNEQAITVQKKEECCCSSSESESCC